MRPRGNLSNLFCSLALIVAGACGDVKEQPDAGGGGDGDFTLSVSPSTLNVPIASSDTVTLAVDRTGSIGDISLAVQGLPAGVTATFAPNPIPAGMNTSEVTISVAGGTPAGDAQITFVGTAGAVEKTATLAFTASTITVTGKVSGDRAGITVRIVGKPAVVSDASGNFTFTDVTPPYDLYTVANGGFVTITPTVYYYDDLTRTDPVVTAASVFSIILPLQSTATVSGTKLGSGNTTSPLVIRWSNGGGATTSVTGAGAYSVTAGWPQASTNTGTLYALQWTTKPSGAPDAYLGYAATNSTLSAGVAKAINFTMAAPATAALTGTIGVPSGFPAATVSLTQQLGNVNHVLWTTSTATADATIPVIGAGTTAFYASSTAGGATTAFVHPALDAATDVSFTLPAPSIQTNPIDAATGVTATTEFQFSASPMAINQVGISTAGVIKASYQIITTATSVTIPVIPELPLPANQPFSWSVLGFGPHADVNEAATAAGLEYAYSADFEGPRHFYTNGTDRTFTSAP